MEKISRRINFSFYLLSAAFSIQSAHADDALMSVGLQYQNVVNYFNQPPSSGYGEEAITAYGIKLEAIKLFSESGNMIFYYGITAGLLTGSYSVETAGPTSGSGSLDIGANLGFFSRRTIRN